MKIIGICVIQFIGLTILFSAINGQFRDEPCRLGRRGRGICTYIGECLFAQEQLRKRINPQICGFEDYDALIVCCPKNNQSKDKPKPIVNQSSKSVEYCKSLNNKIQQNTGLSVVPAVVGGERSSAAEFPHMAALGFGDEDDKQWLCGGSLINENFVVTAAHCLYSQQYGDVAYVRLGDLNLKSITDDAQPQDYNVVKAYIHPNYKPPSQYNDIALVQLDQPAYFNMYVRPACLYTTNQLPSNLPIATGWGRLGFTGETSDELMKVTLTYYTNQQCSQSFKNVPLRRLPNGIVESSQLCAGGKKEESKDTCQGDSGGPLQILTSDNPKEYYIVGITSFGKACGVKNTPGVYTRISNYIQWIESVAWP